MTMSSHYDLRVEMRVVSKKAITEFITRYPSSASALWTWHKVVKDAAWSNLAEVRTVYPHADSVDRCTVFNIKGNHYRLIARVNYQYQKVYIRNILAHKEYDKGDWKDGCRTSD